MSDDTLELTPREPSLDDVLAEYVAAEDAGQPLDREALLARHPQHAAELREFFTNRDAIKREAAALRGLAGEPASGERRNGQPLGKIRYFGDYELIEEIAAGGMGIVYKARQVSLNRIVAVKMILKGTLANEDDVKRFRAEAEAAASLQHPAIVAIHEVGLHEGQHYFSMDYVDGQSLAQLPREQPLTARQAGEYVRDAAEAVHYAHQQGTLHRDLKPSNILIDRQGRVRITDFGLAKRIEGDSGLTHTGEILGTPSYMPPEQAGGKRSLIGTASDGYSLGAVLYELLAGRPPFRGESPAETLRQVESLDAISPRLLSPNTPRDLETICLKCLEKEPHKRYGTAQLLADDIGRYLRGEPILARPISRAARAWRWCRRNPVVAGLIATVAACLIVGTVVSSYFAVEARDRAAAESFQRKRADDKTAEAVRDKATAEEARADADRRKTEAEASAILAEQRRKEVEDSAELARRRQYITDMNFAQLAWEDSRVGDVVELLERHRPRPNENDLRGFEWYYWNRLCHLELVTIKHPSAVTTVAFSPDGMLIATGSYENTVQLWDAATGKEIRTLKGHADAVQSVAFSSNGKQLASASRDQTVKLWDTTTGVEILTIKGHTHVVYSVAFSPDGTRIASASNDGTVKLWDADTGKEIKTREGHTQYVDGVAFSPDGARIASASADETVRLWDTTTWQVISTLTGHTDAVVSVAFSPDGTRIASASDDKTVKLWDAATGLATLTLTGHTGIVNSVVFSPDGTQVASASDDKTVRLWDLATGQSKLVLWGHPSRVFAVAFSRDGSRLASSGDKSVKLWDATTEQSAHTLKGHTDMVDLMAFSPDGTRLATASHDRTVRLWNTATGHGTLTLKGQFSYFRDVAFSADGTQVITASYDNKVKLWDASTGEEQHTSEQLHPLKKITGTRGDTVFSPDKTCKAVWIDYGEVQLWNAITGEKGCLLKGHTKPITCVAFSPDGTRIATGSSDFTVKLWDTRTGQETLTLKGHSDKFYSTGIFSIAFSPDGTQIASGAGGMDQTAVKLWNAPRDLPPVVKD